MRSLNLWGTVCCALLLTVVAGASDKKNKDAPLQASNVHFTVVKDDNNKPVRNASVVLHPVDKNGGQSKGGFQIKTDNEGKVRCSARRPNAGMGNQAKASGDGSALFEPGNAGRCECCVKWAANRRYRDNLPDIGKSPHCDIWYRDSAEF